MDTTRGAAVVAVVLMHAELEVVARTGVDLPIVGAVNDALVDVRMPLLVLLSGLLLPRSLAKGMRSHLRGKAVHILWPYAVWGLLDCTHAVADAWLGGRPLPWQLYIELLHDPHTYLWFLGYLFAYHVIAGLLPGAARVAAVPLVFLVGEMVPDGETLNRFVVLLGFFLLGDVLARVVGPRVPRRTASAAARISWEPLAVVGRSSLVFYACHLLVLIDGSRLLHAAGLTHGPSLWVASSALALGTGALLLRLRDTPAVGWLFAWPGAGRALRRGGAPGPASRDTQSKPVRPVYM